MRELIAYIMSLLLTLGPKLEEAWPHIKKLGEELDHILTIINGGKPIVHASGASLGPDSQKVYDDLVKAGINSTEARKFAMTIETAQDRTGT